MTEKVIMAGWGGQGMMTIGKLLVSVMLEDGKQVTFFPSYGAEVRGGTAHCHVVISTDPIYLPVVEEADALIIMNQPSYEKFHERLRPGGLMIVNSTLVTPRDDVDGRVVKVAATDLANELGNVRVANVIMLGLYNELCGLTDADAMFSAIAKVMTGRKAGLLDINRKAFEKGRELAQALSAERRD